MLINIRPIIIASAVFKLHLKNVNKLDLQKQQKEITLNQGKLMKINTFPYFNNPASMLNNYKQINNKKQIRYILYSKYLQLKVL